MTLKTLFLWLINLFGILSWGSHTLHLTGEYPLHTIRHFFATHLPGHRTRNR